MADLPDDDLIAILKKYQPPSRANGSSRAGAIASQSVPSRAVYPYDGTANVLDSLQANGNRPLAPVGQEIKAWTPPKWQDQAGDWLSQKLMDYGMPRTAAISDANRISSLLGFIPPIAAHDGGVDIGEGYRSGDYGQMGAGAFGVAGAALPFAGRALSRGAAAEAKAVAPTPWGSTDAFLDKVRSTPQPYVHPLNVPATPKAREPLSAQASRAREQQILDEARQFLTPTKEPGRAFDMYEGRRYLSPTQELDDTIKLHNTPGSSYGLDLEGRLKESGLLTSVAKDLERHSALNENIPVISEKAQEMADRARGFGAIMDADEAKRLRNLEMKWKSTESYLDDAYRFNEPRQNPWADKGDVHVMESDELHDILRHHYGANYQDPGSWSSAYQKFWDDETARRAAGKPTWHSLSAKQEAQAEADYLKRETGVDAFKASKDDVDKALTSVRDSSRSRIDQTKKMLDDYEASIAPKSSQSFGDAVKRHAIPATLATGAVLGGQAAYDVFRQRTDDAVPPSDRDAVKRIIERLGIR